MHYRNGREAKNGDPIVQLQFGSGSVVAVGTLVDAQAGNDYCNGYVETSDPMSGVKIRNVACLCDCLHVDDLAEILKQHGLDKRPPGK